MASALHGIVPPMTIPFTAEGEIDERAFRAVLVLEGARIAAG